MSKKNNYRFETLQLHIGQEQAWRFIDSLEIFSLLANVADVKSLVILCPGHSMPNMSMKFST